MKDLIKNNLKIFITLIIVIVIGIIGIAYAYVSNNITVSISSGNYSVVYSGTSTLPSSSLTPILDSDLLNSDSASKIMKIEFTVKGASTNPSNVPIIYDVALSNLNLPEELKSELLKWRLYKNNTLLTSGNFSDYFDLKTDNRMVLTEIQQDLPSYSSSPDSYTFYIWISEPCTGDITSCNLNSTNTTSLMNKAFSGEIRIETYTKSKQALVRNQDTSGANRPDLVDGLIPVIYSNGSWVKADSANVSSTYKWYDYDEKQWANAVLVTSTNRSTYQSASAGTTIADADILAFYVWIPRFKYKVWNINKVIGTDSYNAQTTGIDIVFERGTASTGTISCTYDFTVAEGEGLSETCTGSNEDYYTHPAFTFGSDELTGFWIGKFELSELNGWTDYTNYGKGSQTNPTILPNVASWRNSTVSIYWNKIYNMQASDNIYGLSTSRANTDSHMITNMEWGAVAYLTNSEYGLCADGTCTDLGINNVWDNSDGASSYSTYYTTKTGCGAAAGSDVSTTCNAYNTTDGMLASTTGNIYGVYDISGGSWDYTVGNMSSTSGSYTYNVKSAGSNYTYTGYEKYITTYAYGATSVNQTAYNRARLGDATSESKSWYTDVSIFLSTDFAWFARGGNFYTRGNAGAFCFRNDRGGNLVSYSSRATLAALS